MVIAMRFVGANVADLLSHDHFANSGPDVVSDAEHFLRAFEQIGDPFDLPWKFTESLEILRSWLPRDLERRLFEPGQTTPENHLEASIVALALEAGVRLQPLTRSEMRRLQHVVQHASTNDAWGRQSSYPWDTVASAQLDNFDFFALSAPST